MASISSHLTYSNSISARITAAGPVWIWLSSVERPGVMRPYWSNIWCSKLKSETIFGTENFNGEFSELLFHGPTVSYPRKCWHGKLVMFLQRTIISSRVLLSIVDSCREEVKRCARCRTVVLHRRVAMRWVFDVTLIVDFSCSFKIWFHTRYRVLWGIMVLYLKVKKIGVEEEGAWQPPSSLYEPFPDLKKASQVSHRSKFCKM